MDLFGNSFFRAFSVRSLRGNGKNDGLYSRSMPKGWEFRPWFEPEVIVQDGCDDRGEAVKRLESEKGKTKHKRVSRLGKL
jgi:hypothetical protein